MGTNDEMLNLVWSVIDKFIKDWQSNPYKWSKEIDIQVDIANRIISEYRAIGTDTINASYDVKIKGFEQTQVYSRVCCEPQIYYQWDDGKRDGCFPDIVIFDDIDHPELPPDRGNEKKNWPMLWVCEIKYLNEWSISLQNDKWDIEKMRYLIKQADGAKYACWLTFMMERAEF